MKFSRLILLYFAMLLFLGACGRGDAPLRFAYQDRVGDAAAILTAAHWSQDFPLEKQVFSSGSLTAEALISGNADLATMGDAVAVTMAARYPDKILLLGVHGGGPGRHRLVSRTARPQKIAVKFGTSTHAALKEWLNWEADLVDLPPGTQLSALLAGEVDALAASEPTPSLALAQDPSLMVQSLEIPGRAFPIILVASRKAVDQRPDQINRFITQIRKEADSLKGGVDGEDFLILTSVTGLDAALLKESLTYHFSGFSPITGYLDELAALSEFLKEQGKIPGLPDWNRVSGSRVQ